MRKQKELNINQIQLEKLHQNYDVFCFLNSNSKDKASYYAIGVKHLFEPPKNDTFTTLKEFHNKHKDWIFGYFPYDLKNEVEPSLVSQNNDFISMQEVHFFVPKIVLKVTSKIIALYHDEKDLSHFLEVINLLEKEGGDDSSILLKARISKEIYLDKINKIKEHIQLGDIYEMNFCYEYFAENVCLNPIVKYNKLNSISRAPFSVFYKNKEEYILSASPERFLKKQGDKIVSQPIKGTAKRGATPEEDNTIKEALKNNPKERAENIMIVDLVRNDLSRTAAKASVKVEELCEVYSFDTVHQMISTVTSQINEKSNPFEVIKYAFPMGSMTGAPKVEAMKIIEEEEVTKRGIYSGAIGYFTPDGDFDFNVVIRTILYNQKLNRVSCMVGGAITIQSDPEMEYQETLIKVDAIKRALE